MVKLPLLEELEVKGPPKRVFTVFNKKKLTQTTSYSFYMLLEYIRTVL